jgi:DNA-binding NarL/FixJ family response regulator
MIRILLVDDQSEVRRGLRMRLALEPDFEVVGEAEDRDEAVALAAALQPDVIILDQRLRMLEDVSAVMHLQRAYPAGVIMMLSIHDDPQTRALARAAGAAAFVSKRESPESLPDAIRRAAQRRTG